MSNSGTVSTINPPGIFSLPIYSQVTSVPLSASTKLVTVAGQVPVTEDGTVPSTLVEQIDLCLSKVGICLSAAGAKIQDMTRLVYYVTQNAHNPETTPRVFVDRLTPWLGGHGPASCYIVVAGLSHPEYMVEFEAMAVVTSQSE
ncbi:Endoribonuclease L-PSP/chorismate mutase-like protein [Xylariaceae sp. FL0662B]|nr:Endoribonuclease L-PSP/chorismate mutase-like protein [Xylariaceae sp. FL0662B]